jgi:hypothetical protein
MKSLNLYRAIFLGILLAGFSSVVKSQTCGNYYPLTNGTTWTMTNYDAKGKVDGSSLNQVTSSVSSADGTVATIQTTAKDKKDTVLGTTNTSIKCTAGKVYVDMKSFAPASSSTQYKNMDIKTDGTWLEIPQTLSVGLKLADATGTISIYNEGTLFTTIKITISNRTVAAQESVTTAAGTYTCYKITQDIKTETSVMGFSVPMNMKSTEYYAANTGMVKSMSYDKNSKLVGYSELSSITIK